MAQAWQGEWGTVVLMLDGKPFILQRHIAKALATAIVETL